MQKTSGFYSALNNPILYNLVQKIFSHSATENFVKNELKSGDKAVVCDIGCGTANILSFLDSDYTYFGFDISEDYIADARLKFKDRSQTVFIAEEFNEKTSKNLPKVDLFIMLGIMHHLSDLDLRQTLINISKKMNQNGRLITVDPVTFGGQSIVAKMFVGMDRGKAVRSSEGYLSLLEKELRVLHSQKLNQVFPPYDRFLSVSTLK